jgi:hypothetical protein
MRGLIPRQIKFDPPAMVMPPAHHDRHERA